MHDATRRVTQWIIGVRGEVPLIEELATVDDVQSFVCGHVIWSDGTPGPAIEREDIDFTPWIETSSSKPCMQSCRLASSIAVLSTDCEYPTTGQEPA